MSRRAIVLGGGIDALVAGRMLASAGWRVLAVEETSAGHRLERGWVPDQLARAVGVDVRIERDDPWLRVRLPEGGTLELWQDVERSAASIRRFSPRDAARWPEFCRRMAVLGRFFERVYTDPPANFLDATLAYRVRRLGREAMADLMRILPTSVADLLDEWFQCDALKGALAGIAIGHLALGPRSGGTAFALLHHHVGSPEGVFKESRSNLAAALQAAHDVTRREASAREVVVRQGRVQAVVLDGGEALDCDIVVSGLDPRHTLLELVDPGWLDPQFTRALLNVRRRGVTARVEYRDASFLPLVVAPSLDYLERAYDAAKFGRVSGAPYLDIERTGPDMEVHFQYAPYHLTDAAWNEAERTDIANKVAELVPELRDRQAIVHAPPDLEAHFGWPDGQPYQAELALDQALWMRPTPALAHYRAPVEGLWLCGPAMHPGAGHGGLSGYNCARKILRELR